MEEKYKVLWLDDAFASESSDKLNERLEKFQQTPLASSFEIKKVAYAEDLISEDLTYAQNKLNAGNTAIAAFTYTGKSKAFEDLATLIAQINTGKSNGGTFAVQVDKQWLGD